MNNQFVMKVNETLLWFSILILSYMAYIFNYRYLVVLSFWVIIIISVGNAKRIFLKKYLLFSTILRRSMYVIPFIFPVITDFKLNLVTKNLFYWCLMGIVIGIMLHTPKISEWKMMLSKDMLEITRKKEKEHYFTQIVMLIGAAIGEEIFFRNFVIGYVFDTPYIFSIALSCGLFFLNHFGVKWNNKFSFYDYAIQIIFGILSSVLFIFSRSILPSIIAHLIYNFPPVLLTIKSYVFHYISKDISRGEHNE